MSDQVINQIRCRLTYQINIEKGPQDLATLGECSEDFRRGEGGVKEQAASNSVDAFPQQGWQHKQMVVMNPHIVKIGGDLGDHLVRKQLRMRSTTESAKIPPASLGNADAVCVSWATGPIFTRVV